jgi:hypothetical protein
MHFYALHIHTYISTYTVFILHSYICNTYINAYYVYTYIHKSYVHAYIYSLWSAVFYIQYIYICIYIYIYIYIGGMWTVLHIL